jgi:hypothetical protein
MRESKEAREARIKEEKRKCRVKSVEAMREIVKKNMNIIPSDYFLAFKLAEACYKDIAFHVYMHGCDRVDYVGLLYIFIYGFVMGNRATLAGKFKEEE